MDHGPDEASEVVIHGESWKLADIEDEVAAARAATWRRTEWSARDALVDKSGGSSREYAGGYYDPDHFSVVTGGWDHDHCSICWWKLDGGDDAERRIGYRSGDGEWLCAECHGLFVGTDGKDL